MMNTTTSSSLTSTSASSSSTDSMGSLQRFTRRLRVVTEPRRTNKNHHTRTLSELIFMSPRNSPRVTPRTIRFDMDIEVHSNFESNGGTVDVMCSSLPFNSDEQELDHELLSSDENDDSLQSLEVMAIQDNLSGEPDDEVAPDDNQADNDNHTSSAIAAPQDVSGVVDMLFEMHSALTSKHVGQRTAASALANSNLVSEFNLAPNPIDRDDEMVAFENARSMLECSICQDIFSNATEVNCCGQIFCRDCIERWVVDRQSCPMCRDPLNTDMLLTCRHAQRMANEMNVVCQWCNSVMKKAMQKSHLVSCDKAPIPPPPAADVALRLALLTIARLSPLNFRPFLTRPSPPEADMTRCYVRQRSNTYHLFTLEGDVLLASATKKRNLDMSACFIISMAASSLRTIEGEPMVVPEAQQVVGRLDRNFVGSQYTIFSAEHCIEENDNNAENSNNKNAAWREVGAVQYAATFGKTPRQMRVAVPCVEEVEEEEKEMDTDNNDEESITEGTERTETEESNNQSAAKWRQICLDSSKEKKENNMLNQIEHPNSSLSIGFINKPPVWIENLDAYCLDFGGRVAKASVKNFLLTRPDDMDSTMMLFGRTAVREIFSMDFRHPLSPLQAFAIALSSMDSHLVTFD